MWLIVEIILIIDYFSAKTGVAVLTLESGPGLAVLISRLEYQKLLGNFLSAVNLIGNCISNL